MQERAQVGGEVGANGFFYNGGQFLPKTKLAKMSKRAQKELKEYTDKRQQVTPFEWATPEDISVRALYPLCSLAINGQTLLPLERIEQIAKGYGWGAGAAKEVQEQAQRWLNGERWVSQDEAPMFWWNEVKKVIK